MSDKYTMHVISHTHWDREWWSSFQHFRMRLVDLTDHLLDLLETRPDFRYFHFDGQTIVLEDYLQIRPENEERLRKLTREGRILIGPWYMQPDEFLVSGEAMIRNLALGRKMCDDWGNYMSAGYVPDCFGHISQLPQILLGFGIDNAVLFRGISTDDVKSEFTWRGPDGSEVLVIKMPDNNAYSNWFYRLRPTLTSAGEINFDQSRQEILDLVADSVREKPTTSHLLFMDGCDHVFPNPKTPDIIRDANEHLDIGTLIHTTLPRFIEAVKDANPDLQTVEGELRCGNRCWNLQSILPNVHSSRIHLKQANHEIQTLLEKWAEPFGTMAWKLGKEYPSSYLALAWKYLLQNQPHDSICGCSIDQVHKDMVYRYDQARMIAEPLVTKSLQYIADRVDTTPNIEDQSDRSLALMVFNPLSWERSEVVETVVDFPPDWNAHGAIITDADGNEIPSSTVEILPSGIFSQEPMDIPQVRPVTRFKIIFLAEDVPSVGYKTFYVRAMETPYRTPGSMRTHSDVIENEHLVVSFNEQGTLYMGSKEDKLPCLFQGMIFEDGGDFGDGWTYRKPMVDTVVTSLGCPLQVSIVEDNALRATLRVDTVMPVPAAAHPNGRERSQEMVDLKISSYLTLTRGSRRVDIVTEVENNAKYHRLRVLFPSEIDAEVSHAESLFDVVARPIETPECRDWREPMTTSHPQKSFVDVSDGESGIAMINEALPEYEVKDDADRTIAISLLRATGHGMMEPDAQVEGQLQGRFRFRYSFLPHKGDWREGQVWRESWAHNVPMRVVQTGIHGGELDPSKSFLQVGSPYVLLSALKKADKDDKMVVRVFSLGDKATDCTIGITDAQTAFRTNLNEEPDGEIRVEDGRATVEITPKQICTLLVD